MVKVLREVKGKKAKKKRKKEMYYFGGRKIKEVVVISLCFLLTPAIGDRR